MTCGPSFLVALASPFQSAGLVESLDRPLRVAVRMTSTSSEYSAYVPPGASPDRGTGSHSLAGGVVAGADRDVDFVDVVAELGHFSLHELGKVLRASDDDVGVLGGNKLKRQFVEMLVFGGFFGRGFFSRGFFSAGSVVSVVSVASVVVVSVVAGSSGVSVLARRRRSRLP